MPAKPALSFRAGLGRSADGVNESAAAPAGFAYDFSRVPIQAPAAGKNQAGAGSAAEAEREPEVDIDFRYYASAKALADIRQSVCGRPKLSQTSITPQSRIDAQTAQVLDDVMERAAMCGSLSQYITLRAQKLAQGHFAVHKHYPGNDFIGGARDEGSRYRFDTDPFHVQVRKYLERTTPGFRRKSPDEQREEIRKVGGFYDRGDNRDMVNLPSDAKFGSALHESVHRISGRLFAGLYGHELNEGVTQLFADVVLGDEGLPAYTGHEYQANLADAQLLVHKLGGWDLVAQLYFQQRQAAHWDILIRLGLIRRAGERAVSQDEILRAIRRP